MEAHRITWKEKLGEKIPVELGREIDIFERGIGRKQCIVLKNKADFSIPNIS